MRFAWLAGAALVIAPVFVTPSVAADSEQAAEKPEPKICRASRATGSRVRVNRVCLTRAQWAEVEEKKKQSMAILGQSGSVSPCGPGSTAGGCSGAVGPGM